MYTVTVNPKRCKNCGLCAHFCGRDVFVFDPDQPIEAARPEQCVGCGICALKCPDFALEIKEGS